MQRLIEPLSDPRALPDGRAAAFRHALARCGMFQDHNLVRILDSHHPEFCAIDATEQLRPGIRNGQPLLEAVHSGTAAITIRGIMRFQPGLQRLVERLYAELEDRAADFTSRRLAADLLLRNDSALSPEVRFTSPAILWQVRGRQSVRLALDSATSREVEFELRPGDALSLPLNSPVRVGPPEGFNVVLVTGHRLPPRTLSHCVIRAGQRLCGMLRIPWLPSTQQAPA